MDNDFVNFVLIWCFSYGFSTVANIGKADPRLFPGSGKLFAVVPLFLTFSLNGVMYLLYLGISTLDFDMRYSYFHIFSFLLYVIVFIVLDISLRNRWSGTREVITHEFEQCKAGFKKIIFFCMILTRVSVILTNTLFICAYLFYILPKYFGSTLSTRLIICLVVHPIAVECNEAIGKPLDAEKIQSCKYINEAKEICRDLSVVDITGKFFFSLSRRFMLLNLGDTTSTMVAIIITSIEEAAMRAFLVEIDMQIRHWLGKPTLEGRELELQQFKWAVDINQSAIAELVSIIVSSCAYIILEDFSLAINIGYSEDHKLQVGVVFSQLVLELLLECLVDNAALWAEMEHSIPVDSFFPTTRSVLYCVMHLMIMVMNVYLALYSFGRYPTKFMQLK